MSTSYPPQALPAASSSTATPPVNNVSPPPPDPPYSFWITSFMRNVKSNDPRLTKDPQALQNFLLTHAAKPPTVLIHCTGTHEEEGTDSDGNKTTNVVEDFNFTVDITSALLPADAYGAPVWLVADEEPAKRGRNWRQIAYDPNPPPPTSQPQVVPPPATLEAGSSSSPQTLHLRKATPLERKQGLDDAQRRNQLGLPPWACISAQTPDPTGARILLPADRQRFDCAAACSIDDFSDKDLPAPSYSLAEYLEDYCANGSPLKEFRFLRTVYGWDLHEVENKVALSLDQCHSGDAKKETAKVIIRGTKIIVRPKNQLWVLFGSGWFKFFLSIILVYPLLLWPIKKFVLGRCWKVAGSSFAFRRYEHLADSIPGETVAQYTARVPGSPPSADLKTTARGISKIVGQNFAD
ncbi:hypothetical protein FRB90_008722, partial [Tulasnella sp. 427]